MRYARWKLRSPLVTIAVVTVLCAGAVKWKRYTELSERIAIDSREERLLLDDYRLGLRIRNPCGNHRRRNAALLAVAIERTRRIGRSTRELARIW